MHLFPIKLCTVTNSVETSSKRVQCHTTILAERESISHYNRVFFHSAKPNELDTFYRRDTICFKFQYFFLVIEFQLIIEFRQIKSK